MLPTYVTNKKEAETKAIISVLQKTREMRISVTHFLSDA